MEIIKNTDGRRAAEVESDSSDSPRLAEPRRRWTLTQEAFESLLTALGTDRDNAATKYLELHRNLVRFFEWRGCSFPDDHADETLNRIAKKIALGEEVRDLASYSLGVARLLLLEIFKERMREQNALKESANAQESADNASDSEENLECLRGCLKQLSDENRTLVLQYYQGEKGEKVKNRRGLVERLGVPVNTLRMRVLRLREKLQVCVEECVRT
jgi:DNA-directed RNA polymerase specialized sigma24 family protein